MKGQDLQIKKETLKISGMTCTACAAIIERAVGKMDGDYTAVSFRK